MNTTKNIGLIECGVVQKALFVSPLSIAEGYSVKKVLSRSDLNQTHIQSRFPAAEIVDNTSAIFEDNSIELVIVSGPSHHDMSVVGEAIQAGKQIRII